MYHVKFGLLRHLHFEYYISFKLKIVKFFAAYVTLYFSSDDRCPGRTFLRYKSKLNKNCVYFFQRQSRNPKEDCWCDSAPIGHNVLGNIMNTISKECQLSQIYTNHSLRATTVHFLDIANIQDRHIMSVTGHKSQSSLKTYTGYS